MINYRHTTVLLDEAVNGLNICPNGIYIDGTFGSGGHSRLILSRLGKNGRLLAIDRDPQAVEIAKTIKDSRFSIIQGLFSSLEYYINERKLIGKIDGILFDLGTSALQLDNAERGFSFMHDGPLDMRMDPTCGKSASEWLKTSNEADIAWVIKRFGEERFSKRIAKAIIKRNRIKVINTTKELVEVISKAIPIQYRYKHPATRTFQAIRIFVNNELEEIKAALEDSLNVLNIGGRISIISFHSLEDRIVKCFMRKHSVFPHILTKIPITEVQLQKLNNHKLRILDKLMPSKEEITNNPRSRSSILRIAEKLDT